MPNNRIIETGLGTVEVSEEISKSLEMRDDATSSVEELERIIRCAMQAAKNDDSVKFRLAVSQIAGESIIKMTGREWR